MSGYSDIARSTAAQLAAKGGDVTVTYRAAGAYNTATGASAITSSTATAKGVILPFNEGLRKLAGTTIALADQQLLLAALGTNGAALTAPKVDDTVTANGKVYSIIDVSPLAPDGTNLLFTCQIRAAA